MLNKVMVIGHVGRDPEVRYAPSGAAMCNFTIASTDRWKDKTSGEKQERTEWFRIAAFDKLAEICGKYIKKGALIYVEGSLSTREYADKEGIKRFSTEVRATTMKMLSKREDDGESAPSAPPRPAASKPAAKSNTSFDDMNDDIPF